MTETFDINVMRQLSAVSPKIDCVIGLLPSREVIEHDYREVQGLDLLKTPSMGRWIRYMKYKGFFYALDKRVSNDQKLKLYSTVQIEMDGASLDGVLDKGGMYLSEKRDTSEKETHQISEERAKETTGEKVGETKVWYKYTLVTDEDTLLKRLDDIIKNQYALDGAEYQKAIKEMVE